MPEINSIPYESAEDLKIYLYDSYVSTEDIVEVSTGTGIATPKVTELLQETGITQNSECLLYYDNNTFNPLYARAIWKMRMNSMDDCFAFFGFKESTGVPTPNMIESHAGFMIYTDPADPAQKGKLYASVADGYHQQRVEIVGIDCVRVENFMIQFCKFSVMPLPATEEQLGLPLVLSIDRKWKLMQSLDTYPPINEVHYLMQYIKNTVNESKTIAFNRLIYSEVYAD